MKCEICGQNKAKYKYYEVDSDSVKELNICEDCALKKGIAVKETKGDFSSVKSRCSNCQTTFSEFKKSNMLGCPECYSAFKSKLDIILRQVHPGLKHEGKVPVRDTEIIDMKKEIRELKKKLDLFVKQEKFEEAVKLRDKIEKQEKKLESMRQEND